MMKRTSIIITCIICSLIFIFNINAENANPLMDWMIEERKAEITEEISSISNLLFDEGYGNADISGIDEKSLITAYLLDTSRVVEEKNSNGSFKNLITDDYFYRYFDPANGTVTEIISDSTTGEWIIGATSLEIDGLLEKFPEISYLPNDITANLINLYPTLDYSSVKFIYLMEVSQTLVYFTCEDEEYVAYYPLVEIDNGLNAGEIYTAGEVLEVLSEYPIYNPIVGGEIGGGIVAKQQDPLPWYIYPAIGISVIVIVGVVGYVIIKRKKAEQ